MASYDWSFARPVKRLLSVYEKSTLPTTEGRALIMPAEPNTEVEELVEAGYISDRILCVEYDGQRAQALYQYYAGFCQVFNEDVGQFMAEIARVPGTISYAHLDYNGHIKADVEVVHLSHLAKMLAPTARVRITMLLNRKHLSQVSTESDMRSNLLVNFAEGLRRTDPVNAHAWTELRDGFRAGGDITQVASALLLMQLFFGQEYWSFAATAGDDRLQLPTSVQGRHLVDKITRYEYNDDHNVMSTVWIDAVPLPDLPILESPLWRHRYLLNVFTSLAQPVISYNPLARYT